MFFRIEAGSLVSDADGNAGRCRTAQGRELDVDVLLLVVAVPVFDGVDHRLANRDAHPMQGVVVKSGEASEVIACHLHEVEHFVRAVKFETDCFPLRHAPRQGNYNGLPAKLGKCPRH